MTNINSFNLNSQAVNDNQPITKLYVDQLHQDNEQCREVLGIDFCNQSNDLVKKTKTIFLMKINQLI